MWILTLLVSSVAAIATPQCQSVAPSQKTLQVRTTNITALDHPFGLVYASPDIAFASLGTSLGVLNTSNFIPSFIHNISLPSGYEPGFGLALKNNHVVVAATWGGVIFDAKKAITGEDAFVGTLNGTTTDQKPGNEAIEVTLYKDYSFVSQEYGASLNSTPGNIDVFKNETPVGFLNLGEAVVGTALSRNRKILYATSELANRNSSQGSLSAIDVETLTCNPSQALRKSVLAGCGPVRVIVGDHAWVTARESNSLLAFSHELELIASVQVGTSPVGLTFAKNGTRILTADSNRFGFANATSGISVVDVQAALAGKDAVLGRIPTGKFPREFAVSPDGRTVLVSVYGSQMIQAIDVDSLP